MYAIAFDMVITDLRANYGEPYNNAYFEINKVLRQYEFYNTQGSVYLTEKTDMANLFRAIDALKRIPWFQASVRDLRAFRVEDWSNFTDFIKAPFISQLLFPPLQLWKVLLHRFPCFLHCVFHFRVFIELIQIIQIKLDHLVHGTLFREMSVRIAIVAIIFVLATVRFFSKS